MGIQFRQEMQNYELQTASKTLLSSHFQALPKEMKQRQISGNSSLHPFSIRSGSMMHVADHMDFWNANLQSPFFLDRLYELLA